MNRFDFKIVHFEIEQLRAQPTDQHFESNFVKRGSAGLTAQFVNQLQIGAMGGSFRQGGQHNGFFGRQAQHISVWGLDVQAF
jgi:hypothetical protein